MLLLVKKIKELFEIKEYKIVKFTTLNNKLVIL